MKEIFFVQVNLQIHASCSTMSSADVLMARHLQLPFVPFVGLQIVDGDWSVKLTDVVWDIKKNVFQTYVESDKELYNASLNRNPDPRPISEIVAEYYRDGWRILDSPTDVAA